MRDKEPSLLIANSTALCCCTPYFGNNLFAFLLRNSAIYNLAFQKSLKVSQKQMKKLKIEMVYTLLFHALGNTHALCS